MAIKPTKASFTLNANLSRLKQPVNLTITNLKINNVSLSSEGEETSENVNAQERYGILYKSGLNPLKAHIVANTEFVPVSTVGKTNSDASTINLNFGEESSITVTNVAKLITLHRQIREYMLNTAEELLSRVEDFHVPAFHQAMHYTLNTGFVWFDRSEAGIEVRNKYATINKEKGVQGGSVTTPLFYAEARQRVHLFKCIKTTSTGAVDLEGTIGKIIDDIRRLPESSLLIAKKEGKRQYGQTTSGEISVSTERQRRYSLGKLSKENDFVSLVALLKRKKDDPLVRSLIEYVVYEVVVLEAIEYMSGLLRLKDELDDAYSYSSTSAINKVKDVTDNSTFKSYFTSLDRVGALGNVAKIRMSGDYNIKKHLGFSFSSGAGDIEELLNVVMALASKCLLIDSDATISKNEYHYTSEDYDKDAPELRDNTVFNQWSGDLCRAMSALSHISFEGACIQGEEHTYTRPESRKFTLETMKSIEAMLEAEPDHRKRYGEMLAAVAFDSVYELTGRCELDLELPKLLGGNVDLLKGSDGTAKGEATISSYLRYALGNLVPVTDADNSWQPVAPMPDRINGTVFQNIPSIKVKLAGDTGTFVRDNNRLNFGALGEFLTSVPISNDDINYVPFESKLGKLKLNPNTVTYYTGPEYFIDKALQEGDLNFKEFQAFINKYVRVAEAFAADILKLTNAGHGYEYKTSSSTPGIINETSLRGSTYEPLGNGSPVEILKSIFYQMGFIAADALNNNEQDGNIPGIAMTIQRMSLKGGKYRAHTTRTALAGMFNSALFQGMGIGGANFANKNKSETVSRVLLQNHEAFAEEMAWSMLTDFVKSGKLRSMNRRFYMNRDKKYKCVLTDDTSRLLTYYDKNMDRIGSNPKRYGANKFRPNDDYKIATRGNSNRDTFKVKKTSGDTVLANALRMRQLDGSSMENAFLALHPVGAAILISEALSDGPNPYNPSGQASGSARKLNEAVSSIVFNPSSDTSLQSASNFGGPQPLGSGRAFASFLMDGHLTYNSENPAVSTKLAKINNTRGRRAADELFDYLSSNSRSAFVEPASNNKHRNGEKFEWKWKYQCRNYGPLFQLGIHHRGIIWHQWVALCLRRYVNIALTTHNPSGMDNAFGDIHMYREQMQGFGDALKDVGSGFTKNPTRSSKTTYKQAYNHMFDEANAVLAKARGRQKAIVELATSLVGHAGKLNSVKERFLKYIRSGDGDKQARLAIATMKKNNVYNDSLKLLSKEKVAAMYMDYVSNFRSGAKSCTFSPSDYYDARSTNIMMKILAEKNFGFLSSKGISDPKAAGVQPGSIGRETRGNKTVLHVGITNSMLNTMRYDAYKDTGDRAYLDSSLLAINVYKKNQLNSYELLYPKTYVFDASAFIIDHKADGNFVDHIENYQDAWNFENIKQNITVSRWSTGPEDGKTMNDDTFSNDFQYVSTTGPDAFTNVSSLPLRDALLVNHLHDYAFKKYYRLTLGIDFSENSFLLGDNVLDYSGVAPGIIGDKAGLQLQYDSLARKATQMYPAANLDPQLASELFRVLSLIRSSNAYDCGNKMKRVFYPRMFDRVFSILVNEKDFIIHNDSLSKEFLDIYKSEPNFSMTSEIERPDIKNIPGLMPNIMTNKKTTSNTNDIATVTKRYKASCFNDYPEVYSYYVNISLIK